MSAPNITPDSFALFMSLASDAGNWNGTPLLEVSPAERGNLTQLKRAGLLTTMVDDGCTFADFTEAGQQLAIANGIHPEDLGIWS